MEYGMLHNKEDVKILILYVLSNIGQPLTRINITDILTADSFAHYFTIAECIDELLKSDHLALFSDKEGEPDIYITKLGTETSEQFYRRIPLTIRERALLSAMWAITAKKRNSQISAVSEECNNGFKAVLSINADNVEYFNLSVFAPSQLQANSLCKRFKKNPEGIYQKIIETLIKD